MADTEKSINLAGRKLMIAIPAYDNKLNIDSAFALSNLAVQVQSLGVKLYLTHLSGCSLITKARNCLVADFLKSDADTLLFVDADVVVTADAVLRLLALSLDKDITAGIYPRRGMDRKFFLDYYLDEQGALEFDKNGLMRVKRIGTGFMMIKRKVFDEYKAAYPQYSYKPDHVRTAAFDGSREIHAYFDCIIDPVSKRYLSEDYMFCQNVIKMGGTIWLCPWMELQHTGTDTFGGSLAALASVGASATADSSLIKNEQPTKKKKK